MSFNTIKSKIDEFNLIAGNLTPPMTKKRLQQQMDIILSEINETIEEIDIMNHTGMVNEVADIIVTVFGLFSMLELYGHDMVGATLAVCEKNLEKFPTDYNVAKASVDHYATTGIEASMTKIGGRYIIRNVVTNKVLKPVTFSKVQLEDYIAVA